VAGEYRAYLAASTVRQLNAALNKSKIAVVHWCKDRACGDAGGTGVLEDRIFLSYIFGQIFCDYFNNS
jgi:hypothetical protein